jgi:hypothetical protein
MEHEWKEWLILEDKDLSGDRKNHQASTLDSQEVNGKTGIKVYII